MVLILSNLYLKVRIHKFAEGPPPRSIGRCCGDWCAAGLFPVIEDHIYGGHLEGREEDNLEEDQDRASGSWPFTNYEDSWQMTDVISEWSEIS